MRRLLAFLATWLVVAGAAAQTPQQVAAPASPAVNSLLLNHPGSRATSALMSDGAGDLVWSDGKIVAPGFQVSGTSMANSLASFDSIGNLIPTFYGTTPGTVASGATNSGVLNIMLMGVTGVGQGPAGAYSFTNAVADTQAFVAAWQIATSAPGKKVYLPCGYYSINATGENGFSLNPGYITVSGATQACTTIYWNDFTPHTNLFTVSGSATNLIPGIYFENLTLVGSWDTNGFEANSGDPHLPGNPFFVDYAKDVHFSYVSSISSRNFCFRTQHSISVQYDHIHAEKCSRDALSDVYSNLVSVTYSTCYHNGDDGISLHSSPKDTYGIRSQIIAIGNELTDCGSIRLLGARNFTVQSNIIELAKNAGIAITTSSFNRGDAEGTEAALNGTVSDNVISGCTAFMVGGAPGAKQNAPDSYRCQLIALAADSAGPGNLTGIPGMNASAGAGSPYAPQGVIATAPFFQNNPSSTTGATLPVPPSGNIVIHHNVMGRPLPLLDGSTPGFASISDWSQKVPLGAFYESGWYNHNSSGPTVDALDGTPDGLQIKIGAFSKLTVDHNIMFGLHNCFYILPGTNQVDDAEFDANQCINFSGAAYSSTNTSGILKIIAHDDIIDGDPEYQSPLRGKSGSWIATPDQTTQFPIGVAALGGNGGFEFYHEHYKNLYRVSNCDTSANWQGGQGPCNIAWFQNWAEAYAVGEGYQAGNRGIGVIDPEGGLIYTIHDYAPTDNNWNGDIPGASIQMTASSVPTAGDWVRNRRLTNTAPVVVNGYLVEDWLRMTTGFSNRLGTDWLAELRSVQPIAPVTYLPNNVQTNPVVVNPNDAVSLCNNTGTVPMHMTLAAGTPANDNLLHRFANVGPGPCDLAAAGQAAIITFAANDNRLIYWRDAQGVYDVK